MNVQKCIYFLQLSLPTFTENTTNFAASSTTTGDTSGPTYALSSTEKTGTETPTTSGDVTATFESTSGGRYFIINNYLYS